MLVESKFSHGIQQNADSRTRKKSLTSTNPVLVTPQKKDLYFGQTPPSSNKAEEKQKGIDKIKIFNTSANLFALAAYTVLVGSALVSIVKKPGLFKVQDGLEKTGKAMQSNINVGRQIAENKPRPLALKIADKFGELKENSDELTNNMVYAFGTLVIMPLVIILSPFGKKDASKEDRIFTVFRQPLSFATTFGAQLTVEKLIKGAIPEMRKYGLLSGKNAIKDKNGNPLEFNEKLPQNKLKEKFEELKSKLGKGGLDKTKQNLLNHMNSDQKAAESELQKLGGISIFKGETLKLDSQISRLKEDIKNLSPKDKSVTDFMFDKVKGAIDGSDKATYENYLDKSGMAHLKDAAHECFTVQRRNVASKNMSQVFINSTVSQAISLIALTFIYGKMMKQVMGIKQNFANEGVRKYKEQQNKEQINAEKGGVQ